MRIKIQKSEHANICFKFKEQRNTIDDLAAEYNVSTTCIERILRLHQCRRSQRIYSVDEQYFEAIDTPNKAYFLGLLFSDGCNKTSTFAISLQEEDGYLLDKFKEDLKYDGPISRVLKRQDHHKDQMRLEVSSVKMCKDLKQLGCVPAKSLILKFPSQIPSRFMSHFLRGYFDGDGSVYEDKCRDGYKRFFCNFTGSPDFCFELHLFLKKHLNLESKVCSYKRSQAKDVKLSTRNAIALLDWMYRDASIKMSRKFDRFISFLKEYLPLVSGGSHISDLTLNEIRNFWLKSVGIEGVQQIGARKRDNSKSKYFGVEWSRGAAMCRFKSNGKRIALGTYTEEEAAARAYDAYCEQHGIFPMRKNFPNDTLEFNQQYAEEHRSTRKMTDTRREKISLKNSVTWEQRYGPEEAAKRKAAQAGKRLGIPRGPVIPVTIDGITYPSKRQAAIALGVCQSTIDKKYFH